MRRQKSGQGRIRIGYLSFADWKDASKAKWHLLDLSKDYHGAPQIFYFRPHKKWYLVYQLEDKTRGIPYGPCYSTTDNIADPTSWTTPAPFYKRKPEGRPAGLDFWIICDDEMAHLFFTSLDGRMWRASTDISDFPDMFEQPKVVLRGDVFEASHTYRLRGLDKYVTLIEAQGKSGGRGHRYYKAYIADRLDGEWKELAASANKPFAGSINVRLAEPRWTDSFSHGELLRAGHDERLEVDPANLRFIFQGLADEHWGQ
ncbi:MAG: glycoside hydrolase family 62 [Planctomycetaceae bacterium]|nr:glycoside hydrolase family 62 [Planctomycetaceae bacterium]